MVDVGQFTKAFVFAVVVVVTAIAAGALSERWAATKEPAGNARPAKAAVDQRDPEKRLVPSWYLARYGEDGWWVFGYNQFLGSLFALGLFLYPAWGIAFTVLR